MTAIVPRRVFSQDSQHPTTAHIVWTLLHHTYLSSRALYHRRSLCVHHDPVDFELKREMVPLLTSTALRNLQATPDVHEGALFPMMRWDRVTVRGGGRKAEARDAGSLVPEKGGAEGTEEAKAEAKVEINVEAEAKAVINVEAKVVELSQPLSASRVGDLLSRMGATVLYEKMMKKRDLQKNGRKQQINILREFVEQVLPAVPGADGIELAAVDVFGNRHRLMVRFYKPADRPRQYFLEDVEWVDMYKLGAGDVLGFGMVGEGGEIVVFGRVADAELKKKAGNKGSNGCNAFWLEAENEGFRAKGNEWKAKEGNEKNEKNEKKGGVVPPPTSSMAAPYLSVAASDAFVACGSDDGRIVLYPVGGSRPIKLWDALAPMGEGGCARASGILGIVRVVSLAFSRDGSWLVSAVVVGERGSVEVRAWRVGEGEAGVVGPEVSCAGRVEVDMRAANGGVGEVTVAVAGGGAGVDGVGGVWGGGGGSGGGSGSGGTKDDVLVTPVKRGGRQGKQATPEEAATPRTGRKGATNGAMRATSTDGKRKQKTPRGKGVPVEVEADTYVRALVTDVRGGRAFWLNVLGKAKPKEKVAGTAGRKDKKRKLFGSAQEAPAPSPAQEAPAADATTAIDYALELVEVVIPPAPSPAPGLVSIDDRVELYWSDNVDERGRVKPEWFKGTVQQVDAGRKRMLVRYDDKQVVWEFWEGPEALQWRHEEAERKTEAVAAPPAAAATGRLLVALCGDRFDHLAVLDIPRAILRLYALRTSPVGQEPALCLLDEVKTTCSFHEPILALPSHMAVSPDGRRIAITHPKAYVYVFDVNTNPLVLELQSPSKLEHQEVMPLGCFGFTDWDAPTGRWEDLGQGKKPRVHTWHSSAWAPDSTTLFCTLSTGLTHTVGAGSTASTASTAPAASAARAAPKPKPPAPTELNGTIVWDLKRNYWKSLLRSDSEGVEHRVVALVAHPLVRPMRLFCLTSTGIVNVWASKLVQDWTLVEPHWEFYESNKVYHEKEDDWDLSDDDDPQRLARMGFGHPIVLGPGRGDEILEID